jgi:hypothetical protein
MSYDQLSSPMINRLREISQPPRPQFGKAPLHFTVLVHFSVFLILRNRTASTRSATQLLSKTARSKLSVALPNRSANMSVGSLTTTFTPPASCLESFSTTLWNLSFYLAEPTTTQGCMPDNFQFSSTNFYSPGICPVGYVTACQHLNVIGTLSETVVTCCLTFVP